MYKNMLTIMMNVKGENYDECRRSHMMNVGKYNDNNDECKL